MGNTEKMQAVILTGGLGTRLRPLTYSVPKGMVEIKGRPFLEYLILYLKRFGVGRILLCTGYLGEMIEEYFKDGLAFGVEIAYSREETPLGTGGALKKAFPLLEEEFFLTNGDTLLPVDYRKMREVFKDFSGLVMIGAYPSEEKPNLSIDGKGVVTGYSRKGEGVGFAYVDAGVSLFRRGIAEYFPGGEKFSLENEVYPKLIESAQIKAFPLAERFYDIGTPEGVERFEEFVEGNENEKCY